MEYDFKKRLAAALSAAGEYGKRGWLVFPVHGIRGDGACTCGRGEACDAPGKHPLVKWKSNATTDLVKLKRWWSVGFSEYVYNLGIVTGSDSGITVIDIDPRHGGLDTWNKITAGLNIPDTYTVNTGGSGYHLYFKYCAAVKTGSNVFGPGVDVRNDGGYILAPPSLHASGKEYALSDGPTDLADFPAALLSLKAGSAKPRGLNGPSKAAEITADKAKRLLSFIDSGDFTTWFNVGIILGRAFKRSDEGWGIYAEWSDRGWDGDRGPGRLEKMRSAYYKVSTESPSDGRELSLSTLYQLAYRGGYSEIEGGGFDISLFCYLASENAFIFLPSGDKWLAAGVDGTVPPVINDVGEVVKPSRWLINNKAAISLVSDGFLPNGLIDGYFSVDGTIRPLTNSRLVNLFSAGNVFPLALVSDGAVRGDKPATAPVKPPLSPVRPLRAKAGRFSAATAKTAKVVYDAPSWFTAGVVDSGEGEKERDTSK